MSLDLDDVPAAENGNIPELPKISTWKRVRGTIAGVFFICAIFVGLVLESHQGTRESDATDALKSQIVDQPVTITDYLTAMGYDMSTPIAVTVGKPIGGTKNSTDCSFSIGCDGGSNTDPMVTPTAYSVRLNFGGHAIGFTIVSGGGRIKNTAPAGHPYLILSTQEVTEYYNSPTCTAPFWSWSTPATCTWSNPPRIDPDKLAELKGMDLTDLFARYVVAINASSSDIPG